MCRNSRVVAGLIVLVARGAAGAIVPVSTAAELVTAINGAAAGDVITLAPGVYAVGQSLLCDVPGSPSAPIVVRAENLGAAEIRFDAVEGFKVSAPHWIFENLVARGVCASDSNCEHAFHIVGGADFTRIRDCRLLDFNAQIKGNGEGDPYVFPDDVVIERCELANDAIRNTSNPVTPIDVVGGRRWIVRNNFIHDHAKGLGNEISYAAFLKGNSRDGLFERNLVMCERDHTGGIRLGLSFGGGGSGPDPICEDGTCTPEHQNGMMRNNLIVNCPEDVGIYLNEAGGTRLFHNTLIATTGIDVRFVASTAEIRGNLVSGSIRNRDGATSSASHNLTGVSLAQYEAWFAEPLAADLGLLDGSAFVDQGAPLAAVPADYCRNLRDDGAPDLGAVEYDGDGPCATTVPGGGVDLFEDDFETGGTGLWSDRQP